MLCSHQFGSRGPLYIHMVMFYVGKFVHILVHSPRPKFRHLNLQPHWLRNSLTETYHALANVYQRTVDYPEEFANGYHIMLDTEVLITVRADQVEGPVDAWPPQVTGMWSRGRDSW